MLINLFSRYQNALRNSKNYKWLVLIVIQLVQVLLGMYFGIINISLPIINEAFSSSISLTSWTVIAYAVALVVGIPISAYIPSVLGIKKVFISGFAFYSIGSFLASISPSIEILIATQAILGASAAILLGTFNPIIHVVFPKHQHMTALGINGVTNSFFGIISLLFGGYVVHEFGWNSIYCISAIVALLSTLLTFIIFDEEKISIPYNKGKFDYIGSLLLSVGVGLLFIGLSYQIQLKKTLLTTGIISIILFIIIERYIKYPLIDFKIFKSVKLTVSIILRYIFLFIFGTLFFIMPFYLLYSLNITTINSGKILVTYFIGMFFFSSISGFLFNRIGTDKMTLSGFVFCLLGLFVLLSVDPLQQKRIVGEFKIMSSMLLVGAGYGMFFPANAFISYHAVSPSQVGTVASFAWSIHYLGIASGTSFGSLIIDQIIYRSGIDLKSEVALKNIPQQVMKEFSFAIYDSAMLLIPLALMGFIFCLYRYKFTDK